MTEYDTLAQAQAHPGVVQCHLQGVKWQAYEAGDTLPVIEVDNGVPQEVTMRQARLALLSEGLLSAVDTAINAMSEPAKTAARIEWEYSQTVMRQRGLVSQIGGTMGLTSAQLDALFVSAAGFQ